MNPPHLIQSVANPKLRRLARLRDNRRRRQASAVLVDGWREAGIAAKAGLKLRGLYVSESSLPTTELQSPGPGAVDRQSSDSADHAQDLVRLASERDVLFVVTDSLISKVAYGQSQRGIVAEFEQPVRTLASLRLAPEPLLLILDRIEKPGNLGAIFRCADAAGVDGVIATGEAVDLFNPNAIRSSVGAVFTVPAAIAGEDETMEYLRRHEIRPLAARVESATSMWEIDFQGSLAIIVGNEAEGLQERWSTHGGHLVPGVRIPMWGRIDSLNVSVSSAILLYQARQQRLG
ncbi:MAG: TrmH family RNA methyltransferase [Planctomycetota bacterium]